MYKFFCFKIEKMTKADSYMPCEAMAHSTKSEFWDVTLAMDELAQMEEVDKNELQDMEEEEEEMESWAKQSFGL
jgi:hypothetical protein